MKRTYFQLMRAGFLIFTSTLVFSVWADSGWYAGGGIGASKIDSADSNALCSDIDAAIASGLSGGCSIDDSDTAWKLFAGWRFNPYLAIEGGWADLGDFGVDYNLTDGVSNETGTGTGSASTFFATGVAGIPVGERASIYGKLGIHSWDSDGSSQIVFDGALVESIDGGDSGTDLLYGGGLELGLMEKAAARLEWERYEADEDDLDVFWLTIMFRSGD